MIKSILRISVLIAIATVAFIGIFSSPLDDSSSWVRDLYLSKIIGLIAAITFSRLYSRWVRVDDWIKAYDRWCGGGSRSKHYSKQVK